MNFLKPDSAIGDVGSNFIEIYWETSSEDDFYKYIIARAGYDSAAKVFGTMLPVAEFTESYKSSYTDNSVKPDRLYQYSVIIQDKGGLNASSNPITVRTAPVFGPKGSLSSEYSIISSACAENPLSPTHDLYYAALVYDSRRNMHYVSIFYYLFSSATGQQVEGGLAPEVRLEEIFGTPALVGRKSPLANLLYQKLTANGTSSPVFNKRINRTLTLDQAIDSGYVIEPDIKTGIEFSGVALSSDFRTIFVGLNFYILNNDSNLVYASDHTKTIEFFGIRGIMKFSNTGPQTDPKAWQFFPDTVYNTLPQIIDMRPTSKIYDLVISGDMTMLYIVGGGSTNPADKLKGVARIATADLVKSAAASVPDAITNLVLLDRGTLDNNPVLALQRGCAADSGSLFVGIAGKIIGFSSDIATTIRHPLITFPQSILASSTGYLYVIDPSASGIIVFDENRNFLSKWSQTRFKKLDFIEGDRINGAGSFLIFNSGNEIWGNF